MASNVFCGPCDAQDITISAIHWCPECEEGLCTDCQKHHSVSKGTRSHGVISVENYKKMPTSISGVVHHCKEHSMKYQHYCPQHDEICCPLCVSTNHNKCTDLKAISELIKKSKTSTLLVNMEESLQNIKDNIEQVIKNRKENLSTIKDQRQNFTDDVKQMRVKINTHLDILEEKIINKLLAAENEVTEQIEHLLSQMSATVKEVDDLKNGILATKKYASDLQTFLGTKAMEADVVRVEKYVESLKEDGTLQDRKIKCSINEKVSNFVSYISTFGLVFVELSPPTVVLTTVKNISVIQPKVINDIKVSLASTFKLPDSSHTSNIRGCAVLPNSRILLTDRSKNKRLIVLNSDGSFDKEIPLSGQEMHDVTIMHNSVVAGSTRNGIEIMIFDGEKIEFVNKIETAKACYGITHYKGQILWCEISKGICTSKISGDSISTPVENSHLPGWAYIKACGDNIYATNPATKTVTCYQNNKKLWDFRNTKIFTDPEGITVDNDRNIYITLFNDNKVGVISPDGKSGRIVLTKKDGLVKPWGICFDKIKNTLIVVNQDGTIFVYKIS